jgi:hypothetical protein
MNTGTSYDYVIIGVEVSRSQQHAAAPAIVRRGPPDLFDDPSPAFEPDRQVLAVGDR